MSLHIAVISNFTKKKTLIDLILSFNEKLNHNICKIKMLKCLFILYYFVISSYLGQIGNDLYKAAENDDVETVRRIVSLGFDPNIHRDRDNLTPLQHGASSNNTKVVKVLLEYKANIDAKDKDNQTPLHTAAHFNSAGVAKLLLKEKPNIDARDEDN